MYWILNYLAENQPDELQRINLVVVLGLDKENKRKADYEWPSIRRLQKERGPSDRGLPKSGRTDGRLSSTNLIGSFASSAEGQGHG